MALRWLLQSINVPVFQTKKGNSPKSPIKSLIYDQDSKHPIKAYEDPSRLKLSQKPNAFGIQVGPRLSPKPNAFGIKVGLRLSPKPNAFGIKVGLRLSPKTNAFRDPSGSEVIPKA